MDPPDHPGRSASVDLGAFWAIAEHRRGSRADRRRAGTFPGMGTEAGDQVAARINAARVRIQQLGNDASSPKAVMLANPQNAGTTMLEFLGRAVNAVTFATLEALTAIELTNQRIDQLENRRSKKKKK